MSQVLPLSQAMALAREQERAGRLDLAEGTYKAILSSDPGNAAAAHLLGLVLHRSNQPDEAVRWLRGSIERAPAVAEFRSNLGIVLASNAVTEAQWQEAREAFESAITIAPNFAPAHANLGVALIRRGEALAALKPLRRAVEIQPNFYEAVTHLAKASEAEGDAEAAIAGYRRAIELRPDDRIMHGNVCLAMNYSDRCTPAQIFDEHCRWAERHHGVVALGPASREPIAGRRLRVGYLSSGFRDYPGARFLGPVISNHDRTVIEVFCYCDVPKPDAITERFKSWAEHWRETTKLSDEQVVEAICGDNIDVLIEHIGHMGNNRLGVFARRAAPLQVTYPGYPGTTGLSTMDYCLTDEARAPAGSEAFFTEKLIRMEGGSQCYDPTNGGDETPAVGPPPFGRNGYVTFGCFSRPVKLTPTTLNLWSLALTAVPGSQLLLLSGSHELDHPLLRQALVSRGIAPDRITFLPKCPRRKFLERHNQIDIALDTFPYHGHTTTLDALWMGVPTVSMMGETRPAKESRAVLSAVGLEDLALDDRAGFVAAAVSLANDQTRLQGLRANLREQMRTSPLMGGRRIAKAFERFFLEAVKTALPGR